MFQFDRAVLQRKFTFLFWVTIVAIACSCSNQNAAIEDSEENKDKENVIGTNNRLELIKKRGKLICGINNKIPGFSYLEKDGSYTGISIDLCKAIAVALFDNPNKVEFRHLNSEERFQAVETGKVDILSRNTTWTFSRDSSGGLDFPPTTFYDGQSFLVKTNSEITNLEDLKSKTICVPVNTTSEDNLALQMRKRDIPYSPQTFENTEELYSSYESGTCDAATSDRSQLVARRSAFSNPKAHRVLDEVISKEPLGPVIANGEPEWFDVVEWVSYATIKAEELGINSQNINSFARTKNPEVKRFLGMEEDLGKSIGLSKDFAKKIVAEVGNYEEIYERNIGKPYKLERGVNNLIQNGGLIGSPPFR